MRTRRWGMTRAHKSDVRGEVTTLTSYGFTDTESNFSRYVKIRKNDRPERERNGLNRILGTRAVV
jgi:hypothetical protein